MDQDQKKSAAAEAARAYVEVGDVVGVGTGTTVNHFIDSKNDHFKTTLQTIQFENRVCPDIC